eukprot:9499634-Pyramimonas_sp.AAC.3
MQILPYTLSLLLVQHQFELAYAAAVPPPENGLNDQHHPVQQIPRMFTRAQTDARAATRPHTQSRYVRKTTNT